MNVRKAIKIYSSMITKNIPLFLAVGFLNLFFSESGWFPNPSMGNLSDDLYQALIPVLLGYYAGNYPGRQAGGLAGAMGAAGLVCAGTPSAMTGAIIVGFGAGYLTDAFWRRLEARLPAGFEMMAKNLTISLFGILWAGISFYLLAPCLLILDKGLVLLLNGFMTHGLLPALSLLIEPLKIFFLNNCINHGVLIPMGMEQLQIAGKSVLFLLETNPGPGLGVLLAVLWKEKEARKETAAAVGIHLFGGIHEVYLPYVLANPRLVFAVTAGGLAGSCWFVWMQTGLRGPASPGSILTIVLMSGVGDMIPMFAGVLLSAAVSFASACLLMGYKKNQNQEPVLEEVEMKIHKIYVVCDGGLGSSAMGAALFRRLLRAEEMTGINVLAAASDEIPADADLLICQADFYAQGMLDETRIPVRQVDRLTNTEELRVIVNEVKGRLHL